MSYHELSKLAEEDFPDIVVSFQVKENKLRLFIVDGSFVDVWFSRKLEGRFAYHWERRAVNGKIYRYDNRPHEKLRDMKGFPRHFHNGSDEKIEECEFSEVPELALREFLQFIRTELEAIPQLGNSSKSK